MTDPESVRNSIEARLAAAWPFTDELAELPGLNACLKLKGAFAFDPDVPPVYLVGDLANRPRFLLVGVNPNRGSDRDPVFAAESESLSESVASYIQSRRHYFVGHSFNANHYLPTAKLLAGLSREPWRDPASFLHRNAVQVELVPFFSPHQNLAPSQLRFIRDHTLGGRLAAEVFSQLLRLRWDAIVIRGGGGALQYLRTELHVAVEQTQRNTGVLGSVGILGTKTQFISLTGNHRVADATIAAWAALARGDPVNLPLPHGTRLPPRLPGCADLYDSLRGFACQLPRVEPRPRSGGMRSEAFAVVGPEFRKGGSNFARLIEWPSRVDLHVLQSKGVWREDISVRDAAGVESAQLEIRDAFERLAPRASSEELSQ
ncbi:MAG: hypothetical protein IH609_01455 [Dehalococcoidia bacterium]|nr:hypothetical protein [Dehalococcoidia bacterium]